MTGSPVAPPSGPDVQIFQTAASFENVAVAIYARALDVPGVRQHALLAQFVETTMQQHAEHGAAFNAQVEALGGTRQDAPNPRHAQLVEQLEPASADVGSFLGVAATLEEAASDTYLTNLTLLADPTRRTLMASVMGVEVQHLAMLRAAGTLFEAALPDLVAIPTDVRRLPATIGSIPVPDPFASPDLASPPTEGAVR